MYITVYLYTCCLHIYIYKVYAHIYNRCQTSKTCLVLGILSWQSVPNTSSLIVVVNNSVQVSHDHDKTRGGGERYLPASGRRLAAGSSTVAASRLAAWRTLPHIVPPSRYRYRRPLPAKRIRCQPPGRQPAPLPAWLSSRRCLADMCIYDQRP